MIRTPDFLRAMGESSETTDLTEATLAMFTTHFVSALEDDAGLFPDEQLLYYVWTLKAQNKRTRRVIRIISQTLVKMPPCCFIYLKVEQEHRGPWMSREGAHKYPAMMRAKYGEQNAIIFVD